MTQSTDEFTVHNFSHADEGNLSPSSASALRDEARKLVDCIQDEAGWMFVAVASQDFVPRFTLRNAYQYAYGPPTIKRDSHLFAIEALKEWGEPPDDDEVFLTKDLQPFQSTDLRDPPEAPQDGTRAGHLIRARPLSDGTPDQDHRPPKRPRLDVNPLHDIIPQPHYHPIPSGEYHPFDPARCVPFTARAAVPIPPQTKEAVAAVLERPYARVAWMIPLRGALPYEGATAAGLVLDSDASLDSNSNSNADPANERSDDGSIILPRAPGADISKDACISWTRDTILDFWTFLRRVQHGKHAGPTAISFHPALPDMIPPLEPSALFSSPAGFSPNRYDSPTVALESTSKESESYALREAWRKSRLPSADYVKVFHDVTYTRYLRNVLDAYWYGAGHERLDAVDVGGGRAPKIHPLKGARLVLLDDRGRGLLVL